MSDDNKNKDLYKDTVFLPKTDFPMRGGLPQKEPEILKKWQDMDLYDTLRTQSKDKKKWVLHDGPPYANGHIHIGHALNKILKDVVVRSYQMMGYNAPYVPGWDCHGLPIEWKIEQQYREKGEDKDEVDILQFREECRQFAQKWVGVQSEDFQRLGTCGDWKNPYLTMTRRAEAGIVREIHKFVRNGGLYRGVKPVMWSTVEKTALAEAEVEYKEHKSVTVWVKFPIVAGRPNLIGKNIVIWTTTPWTLPSNRAIAFSKDIEYCSYKVTGISEESRAQIGEILILAKNLADEVKDKASIEQWDYLGSIDNSDLGHAVCHHPLRNKGYDTFDVPVLAGDFVTEEAGTGFVHIAPGHGADDFQLVSEHNRGQALSGEGYYPDIEITDNVTDDGKFREHVPLFAGLEVYTDKGEMGAGNFAVLKAMDEAGALLAKGSLRHEYPHSWRSKAPVIFRTTPQWFIGMDTPTSSLHGSSVQSIDHTHKACDDDQKTLRNTALKAIEETNWVPAKGEARISSMIESRPDWCISRQRSWGVPIALFVHKDTKEVLQDEAVFSRIAETFETEGSDAWWARPASDFLGDQYNADDYEQVFDIVDVWFESGATHAFVLGDTVTWPDFEGLKKADLYLEGSDQHRGWFHSSLLESCGTKGEAPYKTVLTHGFVLDEKGYKMSKSLGNVIDPLKMIDQYGADILRLWTMTSDYAEDIRIGQDMLKSTSDLYRRIRNTFRFLLGALEGFSEDEKLSPEDYKDMPELERYMLHRLHEMDGDVRGHIERFEFTRLANRLHQFCNHDLSAFYFDIRKDCLYCDTPDDMKRRACRTVLGHIFECLTAWLAPILCFTVEEVWSHRPESVFGDDDSVHLREFPNVPEEWVNDKLGQRWDEIRHERKAILEAIEPLRAAKEIRSSLEARPVLVTGSEHVLSLSAQEMADICITSQIAVEKGTPSVSVEKASGEKCQRCWKILPEVGEEKEGLCNRCAKAVETLKKQKAA